MKEEKSFSKQEKEITPRQKTQASQEIFKRLQKKNEQKNKPQESSLNTEKRENIAREKFPQIELKGDLAKAWEALSLHVCTEEEMVEALFSLSKNQKESFLDILKSKCSISSENYKKLQEVTSVQKEMTDKSPPSSRTDLALGQILVEHNFLHREQIQQFLRTQTNLHKLGIKKTLQSLLIFCKAISEDILNPLIAQCEKMAQDSKQSSVEQKNIKKQAILGLPSKKYPVIFCLFAFFILGFSLIAIWLRHESQKAPLKASPILIQPAKTVELPVSEEESIHKEEIIKQANKKNIEEQTTIRDMVLWGNLWIPKKQQEILLQNWPSGSKIENFSLQLLSQELFLKTEKQATKFVWKGTMNIPQGISLKIQGQITSPMQKDKVYSSQSIVNNLQGSLSAEFSFDEQAVLPGVYCLRLIFNAYHQPDFTKFFLGLKENKTWEIVWVTDEPKNISLYIKERGKEIKEILLEQQRKYDLLSQWVQKKQRFSGKEWQEKNKDFLQEFQKLQERLERWESNALVPVYPETKQKVQDSLEKLYQLFKVWSNWQSSFEIQFPEFAVEKAQWEIRYEKSLFFFDKEYKETLEFLETKQYIRIQKL